MPSSKKVCLFFVQLKFPCADFAITVSGKKVVYKVKPTCGIPDRDIMLQLYNNVGMYPGVAVPTPEVLELDLKLHTAEDFIRERLLPHLGLEAKD